MVFRFGSLEILIQCNVSRKPMSLQLLINKSLQFIDSEHSSNQFTFRKLFNLIGMCDERAVARNRITEDGTEYFSKLFKHLIHNIKIHLFCFLKILIVRMSLIKGTCVIKGECFCNLFRSDWIDIFILDVLYF